MVFAVIHYSICINHLSLIWQVFILGFGNIGIDLAKRLRPFGVKVIATKRSWASYECECLHECYGMFISKIASYILLFSYVFVLFLQDDVGDLVDVKGNHEDIWDFAGKADIVVCCLSLNHETV